MYWIKAWDNVNKLCWNDNLQTEFKLVGQFFWLFLNWRKKPEINVNYWTQNSSSCSSNSCVWLLFNTPLNVCPNWNGTRTIGQWNVYIVKRERHKFTFRSDMFTGQMLILNCLVRLNACRNGLHARVNGMLLCIIKVLKIPNQQNWKAEVSCFVCVCVLWSKRVHFARRSFHM